MNVTQLERGKELIGQILGLKKQIDFWEKSKKAKNTMQLDVEGYEQWVDVETTFVNFEMLKAQTILTLKYELELRETEFKHL